MSLVRLSSLRVTPPKGAPVYCERDDFEGVVVYAELAPPHGRVQVASTEGDGGVHTDDGSWFLDLRKPSPGGLDGADVAARMLAEAADLFVEGGVRWHHRRLLNGEAYVGISAGGGIRFYDVAGTIEDDREALATVVLACLGGA